MNQWIDRLSEGILISGLFIMLLAVTLLDQLQATPLIVVMQTLLALALLAGAALIIRRRANTAH
ncbi:MAG: hypothetical protein IT320_09965 [Anaerolineae bacterium]|nr:hypothetical protein [Anaerolineae bacterium]